MISSRVVSLALVGLFIWATACATYTEIGIGEVADHGKVMVTLTDGDRQALWDPTLRDDIIWGRLGSAGKPTVIPVDSVAKVEYEEDNQVVVGLVAVVAIVAVTAAVALAAASSWE